jgi:hypothetical protein
VRQLNWLFVLAACGSEERSGCDDTAVCIGPAIDALPHEPACDPTSGVGCGPDQKCTWIEQDFGGAAQYELIACVDLEGTEVGLDEPCIAVTRANITSDNCQRQLYCLGDRCTQICDPDAPACNLDRTCVTDPAFFAEVGIVFAGLCQ